MARPQLADGGDGLQLWRVAVNILNKQWRAADKGWSYNLGFGLKASHIKNRSCYEVVHKWESQKKKDH
jgi:hypothetical protein